jgi:hypothetical protein
MSGKLVRQNGKLIKKRPNIQLLSDSLQASFSDNRPLAVKKTRLIFLGCATLNIGLRTAYSLFFAIRAIQTQSL